MQLRFASLVYVVLKIHDRVRSTSHIMFAVKVRAGRHAIYNQHVEPLWMCGAQCILKVMMFFGKSHTFIPIMVSRVP